MSQIAQLQDIRRKQHEKYKSEKKAQLMSMGRRLGERNQPPKEEKTLPRVDSFGTLTQEKKQNYSLLKKHIGTSIMENVSVKIWKGQMGTPRNGELIIENNRVSLVFFEKRKGKANEVKLDMTNHTVDQEGNKIVIRQEGNIYCVFDLVNKSQYVPPAPKKNIHRIFDQDEYMRCGGCSGGGCSRRQMQQSFGMRKRDIFATSLASGAGMGLGFGLMSSLFC